MRELNGTSAWPFAEIPAEEGLDINAIFGENAGTVNQSIIPIALDRGRFRQRNGDGAADHLGYLLQQGGGLRHVHLRL